MEGEALDEAVLCPGLVLRDRLVELGQAAHDRDGLVAPRVVVGHLLEEASPQHLRHVFVHQDQRAQAVAAGNFEQLGEERLGRRRLSFFVLVVRVDGAQSLGACKLKGEHAPRMLEGAPLAVRCAHVFNALLGVDLVEAQRGDERLRQVLAHVLAERRHRGRLRQRPRVAEEVVQVISVWVLPPP